MLATQLVVTLKYIPILMAKMTHTNIANNRVNGTRVSDKGGCLLLVFPRLAAGVTAWMKWQN